MFVSRKRFADGGKDVWQMEDDSAKWIGSWCYL